MHRWAAVRSSPFQKEVSDAVENDPSVINLNTAKFMRPMPDDSRCPCIDAGSAECFMKFSRDLRAAPPHLMRMQAHDDRIGLPFCLTNGRKSTIKVVLVGHRLNEFPFIANEVHAAERHAALRKRCRVPALDLLFDRPVDKRHAS